LGELPILHIIEISPLKTDCFGIKSNLFLVLEFQRSFVIPPSCPGRRENYYQVLYWQLQPVSQPHVPDSMGWPRRAAEIMAAAQPVPLSTAMAAAGQLSWQAPHSMQAS
jgi:hypothetical protein